MPDAVDEDSELLEQVRTGCDREGSAVAELYARHFDLARRLAGRLARWDSVADDIAADAFLSCWRHIAAGGEVRSFRRYLCAAIRHRYLDEVRRREKQATLEESLGHDAIVDAQALAVSSGIDGVAEMELIAVAWRALSARHRRVLTLRVFQGREIAYIATQLGLTCNATSVLIHRARRAFIAAYRAQTGADALAPS